MFSALSLFFPVSSFCRFLRPACCRSCHTDLERFAFGNRKSPLSPYPSLARKFEQNHDDADKLCKISLGWPHYLLSEPEPSWLLHSPSRRRGLDLHDEAARDSEGGGGGSNSSMELMGCISIHEHSCEPTEESSCSLPCPAHVPLHRIPHDRHRLIKYSSF